MKMTATIELEFKSAGETTENAMDGARTCPLDT